jgi:hypothetical protein
MLRWGGTWLVDACQWFRGREETIYAHAEALGRSRCAVQYIISEWVVVRLIKLAFERLGPGADVSYVSGRVTGVKPRLGH